MLEYNNKSYTSLELRHLIAQEDSEVIAAPAVAVANQGKRINGVYIPLKSYAKLDASYKAPVKQQSYSLLHRILRLIRRMLGLA